MNYWLLTLILANGASVHTEGAYGSKALCHKHANHTTHICTKIYYSEDR